MIDSLFDSAPMSKMRRAFLVGVTALALAACGGGDTATPTSGGGAVDGRTSFERADDHAIGNANAAVTVVEFASVSCGACANWHNTVYPDFKKKYIDTGKVRYVFREYLAGQPQMADAGFMIALCAGEDQYFKNIGLQFKRQEQIFKMAQLNKLREAYINLAKSSGLSEDALTQCLTNSDLRDAYKDRMQSGVDAGIGGTPGFIINGKVEDVFTLEQIEEVILPLLGEPVPEKTTPEKSEAK